jgi:hypothetical protein
MNPDLIEHLSRIGACRNPPEAHRLEVAGQDGAT